MRRFKIRENAFILMFESLFYNESTETSAVIQNEILELARDCDAVEITTEVEELFCGAYSAKSEIDRIISENLSKKWNIKRISKISLSILRIAVFEIVYLKKLSPSLVINEAVELAKEYSEADDASFINGALGNILRNSVADGERA